MKHNYSVDLPPNSGMLEKTVATKRLNKRINMEHPFRKTVTPGIAVVIAVFAALMLCCGTGEVMGQDYSIDSMRGRTGQTPGSNWSSGSQIYDYNGPSGTARYGTYYTAGSAGNPGSWTQYDLWWGRTATDNINYWITQSGTGSGGTINVTSMDSRIAAAYNYWHSTSNNYGSTGWGSPYGSASGGNQSEYSHTFGPYWRTQAHSNPNNWAGSGGVNVIGPNVVQVQSIVLAQSSTAGITDTLTTSTGGTPTFGYFEILNTTTKTGTGTLSFQIGGLRISDFVGALNGGTLEIADNANTPASTLQNPDGSLLRVGTILSTTVTLNGGNGTIGVGQTATVGLAGFGQAMQSTFNMTSESSANLWTIGAADTNTGLVGHGFNSTGFMHVLNNATLDEVTNIGDGGARTGSLIVNGTTRLGNTAATHVLNVRNNGVLTSTGRFSAGNISGSTTYINDVWGGNFTTLAGTTLAETSGATVVENISNSTRTNSGGTYLVGANGNATLNVFSGTNGTYNGATTNAGILNTTGGDMIFGQTATGVGVGNVFGTDSQVNVLGNNNMIVGDIGRGELYITQAGQTNVSGNVTFGRIKGTAAYSASALYAPSFTGNGYGYGLVSGPGSQLNVTGNFVVGDYGIGELIIRDSGKTTVDGDMIIGKEKGSYGFTLVDGAGTPAGSTELEVSGKLIVAYESGHLTGTPLAPPTYPNTEDPLASDYWDPSKPFTPLPSGTWHPLAINPATGRQYDLPGIPEIAYNSWDQARSFLNVSGNTPWLTTPGQPHDPSVPPNFQIGGELHILNGGKVTVHDDVVIGMNNPGTTAETRSIGLIHVNGVGSSLNVDSGGNLIVGQKGDGRLEIFAGASVTVTDGNVVVGQEQGSNGDILVSGSINPPPIGWQDPNFPPYPSVGKKYPVGHPLAGESLPDGSGYGGGNPWPPSGQPGEIRSRLFIDNGVLQVGKDGHGTLRVTDRGQVEITGKLQVSHTMGSVFADAQSDILITPLSGFHTIAETPESFARYYIQDSGTKMTIVGSLVVGDYGYAGGLYEENRYAERFGGSSQFIRDPVTGDPVLAVNTTGPYGTGTLDKHPQMETPVFALRNDANALDARYIVGDPADWYAAWEGHIDFSDYYLPGSADPNLNPLASGLLTTASHPLLDPAYYDISQFPQGRKNEYRPDLYHPITGLFTGNAPGLAILGGAEVDSTDGVIGEKKSTTHIYSATAEFFVYTGSVLPSEIHDGASDGKSFSDVYAAGTLVDKPDALTRYYDPTGSKVFDYSFVDGLNPLFDIDGKTPLNADAVRFLIAYNDERKWVDNTNQEVIDNGGVVPWMSIGYAVVDNMHSTVLLDGTMGRSQWIVTPNDDYITLNPSGTADNHGHLRVGDEGIGVLRVLNGGLLNTMSAAIARGDESSFVHVVGNESVKAVDKGDGYYYQSSYETKPLTMVADAAGNVYTYDEFSSTYLRSARENGEWNHAVALDTTTSGTIYALDEYGKYIAATPWTYRSEWINEGALLVGRGRQEWYLDTSGVRQDTPGQFWVYREEVLEESSPGVWTVKTPADWYDTDVNGVALTPGDGLGTLRIVDGGYVETNGLYIGVGTLSQGVVSVDGRGSELVINAFTPTYHFSAPPKVQGNNGLFSSSDFGFTQMNAGASLEVTMAQISNGATLYLNNSVIDTANLDPIYRLDQSGNRIPDPSKPGEYIIDGWLDPADGMEVVTYPSKLKFNTATGGYDYGFDPATQKYSTAVDNTAMPVFDTTTGAFKLVNARIVGNGKVGGEKGVTLLQDPLGAQRMSGQAYIDPGLVLPYDPHQTCDSALFYGTLTFGDTLTINQADTLSGETGVLTRFDFNHLMQDLIIVERISAPYELDSSGNPTSILNPTSGTAISATLGGTLMAHARASDYYGTRTLDPVTGEVVEDLNTTRVIVMTNTNDPKSMSIDGSTPDTWNNGTIAKMFQEVELVPKRFFTLPPELEDTQGQEVIVFDSNNPDHRKLAEERGYDAYYENTILGIWESANGPRDGDEMLQLTMTLNTEAFSMFAETYNSKSVGKQLDAVYEYARNKPQTDANGNQLYDADGKPLIGDQEWLPVLRYFWYLSDAEFDAALSYFSGEVRAHSLMLPLQNVARYAQNRMSFRPCACDYPDLFALDLENLEAQFDDPCAGLRDISCKRELAKEIWERSKKLGKQVFFTNTDWWGSYISEREKVSGDGNALGYEISREGVIVGGDRRFLHRKTGTIHTIGLLAAFDEGELDTYRAHAQSQDFNFGLYHNTKFHKNRWEWKNYLGMGMQSYRMQREMAFSIKDDYCWEGHTPGHQCAVATGQNGTMHSKFLGYAFAANTEIARPFYFGKCDRWMVRPFIGLDIAGTWQNAASEYGDFGYDPLLTPAENAANTNRYTKLVGLDYFSAYDIKIYGRPGFTVRRDGPRGYMRGGLSYSYLMGGRPYTDVDNRFQYGGNKIDKFNIRGVSDAEFLNLDAGMGMFFGKDRRGTIWFDYMNRQGVRSYSHAFQVGAQAKF